MRLGGAPVRLRPAAFAGLLGAVLAGCADHGSLRPTATAPTLQGEAHPVRASRWVDTKLYFGLGPADHPERGISDAGWRDFLDREVTPRFPDGLSVVDVYGQWRAPGHTVPERERSKLLIIYHPDTQEIRDRVEAIRAAWKKMTGDQSVLSVTEAADVSF